MVAAANFSHDRIDVSAQRAQIFIACADEIAKIGTIKTETLNLGLIGSVDAIVKAVGKTEHDAIKADERQMSLLAEVFADVLKTRITGRAHLFNLVRSTIGTQISLVDRNKNDLRIVEKILRGVAAKLLNGYAGTWI